ncbi:Chromosome partition protein Smc [Carpediemonas membranifera]|uniref:Chromosome partition protein Smc n=1 Tax=Carpediemonas membranifera TaxID=201153 RepID=A0A8J6B0G9_9EUKA|nr:Chromosome partition protein Smc [Carpediemonas membranifera]|eukprot:KAG9390362.1 Chromosome partition protein Smc [Carpediemonas membranifera]
MATPILGSPFSKRGDATSEASVPIHGRPVSKLKPPAGYGSQNASAPTSPRNDWLTIVESDSLSNDLFDLKEMIMDLQRDNKALAQVNSTKEEIVFWATRENEWLKAELAVLRAHEDAETEEERAKIRDMDRIRETVRSFGEEWVSQAKDEQRVLRETISTLRAEKERMDNSFSVMVEQLRDAQGKALRTDALEDELREMKMRCDALDQQRAAMEHFVVEANEAKARRGSSVDLEEELNVLRLQKTDFETKAEAASRELDGLKKEHKRMSKNYGILRTEHAGLQARVASLTSEREKNNAELAALTETTRDLKVSLIESEQVYKVLKAKYDEVATSHKDSLQDREDLEQAVEDVEAEKQLVESKLKAARAAKLALTEKIGELYDLLEASEAKTLELDQTRIKHETKLEAMEKENKALAKNLQLVAGRGHKAVGGQARAPNVTEGRPVSVVETQERKARDDVAELGETVTALKGDLAGMQRAKDVANGVITKLRQTVAKLDGEKTQLQGRVASLEEETRAAARHTAEALKDRDNTEATLHSRIAALTEETAALQTRLVEAQSTTQATQSDLETVVEALRAERAELEGRLRDQSEEHRLAGFALEQTISQMLEQRASGLGEAEARADDLKARLVQVEGELASVREQNERMIWKRGVDEVEQDQAVYCGTEDAKFAELHKELKGKVDSIADEKAALEAALVSTTEEHEVVVADLLSDKAALETRLASSVDANNDAISHLEAALATVTAEKAALEQEVESLRIVIAQHQEQTATGAKDSVEETTERAVVGAEVRRLNNGVRWGLMGAGIAASFGAGMALRSPKKPGFK